MNTMNNFSLGPYGEILPPPLVGSLSEEECLQALVDQSAQKGQPITVPSRGKSRAGLIQLGVVYVHQQNLAKAIAGQMMDDLDGAALYEDVVHHKKPLSLRPLSLESLWFEGFAPMVQYLGDDTWRIGAEDKGKSQLLKKTPAQIMSAAQQIYTDWSKADDQKWKGWLKDLVKNVKPFYHQVIVQAALTISPDEAADIGADYALQRLGKHTTYQIYTPRGSRILESPSPERAAQMAMAIMQAQGHQPRAHENSQVLRDSLQSLGVNIPQAQGDGWRVGFEGAGFQLQAKRLSPEKIGIETSDKRYGLSSQKGTFMLQELGLKKSEARKPKRLQIMFPPQWGTAECWQSALMWAAWVLRTQK